VLKHTAQLVGPVDDHAYLVMVVFPERSQRFPMLGSTQDFTDICSVDPEILIRVSLRGDLCRSNLLQGWEQMAAAKSAAPQKPLLTMTE
jgi:hypothetical protein